SLHSRRSDAALSARSRPIPELSLVGTGRGCVSADPKKSRRRIGDSLFGVVRLGLLIPVRRIDAVELAQQRGPGEVAVAVGLIGARLHLVEGLFQDVL